MSPPTPARLAPVNTANDSNNNNLLVLKRVDPESSTHNSNQHSELSRKNTLTTLTETGSMKSQLTVIVSEDNLPDLDLDGQSNQGAGEHPATNDADTQPHLTSTPNSRNNQETSNPNLLPQNSGSTESKDEAPLNTSVSSGKQRVSSEQKKYILSSLSKARFDNENDAAVDTVTTNLEETGHDDETKSRRLSENDDKYFDHDYLNKSNGRVSSRHSDTASLAKSGDAGRSSGSRSTVTRRRLYSAAKIALVFFFILFACLLVEFLVCKAQRYNDSAYSCSGQIMNTMRNRVNSYSLAKHNRWVSWVNVDTRSQLLDPIFSWFFSKHRATN